MKGERLHLVLLLIVLFVGNAFILIYVGCHSTTSNNYNYSSQIMSPEPVGIAQLVRGWTQTEVISIESYDDDRRPKIATDTTGNVFITWQNDSGICYRVWNRTRQTWRAAEIVTLEHTGSHSAPSIATDPGDNVHLAWVDTANYSGAGTDYDIFYKRWNATTGTWLPTVVVSTIDSGQSGSPDLVVDHQGSAHIVWSDTSNYNNSGSDSDIFYRVWNATVDAWTVPQLLSSDSSDPSANPSIAVDSNGMVHMVWAEIMAPWFNIYYRCWNATTSAWGAVTLVSTESQGHCYTPKIAVDSVGDAHVIWSETVGDEDIMYRRWDATTGNWTETIEIAPESLNDAILPTLAVDGADNVLVAWEEFSTIFYKYRNVTTGNWTSMEVVPTETFPAGNPDLTIDHFGDIHINWVSSANYSGAGIDIDIFYKRSMVLPSPSTLEPILPNPDIDGIILLNWSAALAATHYYIYRNTSLIMNVTGLVPLKTVPSNSCTDVIATPGNYSYVVVAGNAAGNSTPSNCETVQVLINDTQPPWYAGEAVRWSSPHNYTQGEVYQFNLTVQDNVAVDTVLFQWEGTNYTVEMHVGAEYYYELADLGAGTYQYRWVFNDTADNWNATQPQSYAITPSDPILDVRLNGTPADLQLYRTQGCNITVLLGIEGVVALYVNASLVQSGVAPVINISQYSQAGVYNLTAIYAGTQNYSAAQRTRWLAVLPDLTPPQLAHFANASYLNCTVLEYQHTGLTLAAEVADNLQLDQVLLCTNATGSFANRTMTPGMGDRYELTIDISSLAYGATLAYRFYANDTSGNANSTPLFQLSVHDFISPGPCILNYDPTYAPSFVLENTSFALSGGDDFGGAGVAAYQYRVGAGAWQAAAAFNLSGYSNGFQTLAYRAVDGAGNNGTVANVTVYLLADAADYDGDGLTNGAELQVYFTDPLTADTDGDGFPDGVEVDQGTDPLDAGDNLLVRRRRLLIIVAIIGICAVILAVGIFYFHKSM
jgi:hypothetical protein